MLTCILECSFLCTDLLTCILLRSFHYNLILVFRSSFHCKTHILVFLHSPPLRSFALSFIITHIHFLPTEKNNIYQKRKLQSSSADRVYNQRETTTFLFHTLHSVFLFLSSNFFLLLCSIVREHLGSCLVSSEGLFY